MDIIEKKPGYKEYYKREDIKEISFAEGIEEIGEYAFAECRALTKVVFPKSLKKIEKSAFYNCRKLRTVEINGAVADVEDGAFRNCDSISSVQLNNVDEEVCLKNIIPELEQEFTVIINMKDGATSKLFLPKTLYSFEANEPARIFVQEDLGSGVYYRQAVNTMLIDYKKYDEVFTTAKNEENLETILNIIFDRLEYPYMLAEKARGVYLEYIEKNAKKVYEFIAKKECSDWLDVLLEDYNISDEEKKIALDAANKFDRPYMALKILGSRAEDEKKEMKKSGMILEL